MQRVLTQGVTMVKRPMRLPASAQMRDWNYPDPSTQKPRRACGTIYLGRDWSTGRELGISADDGRQHGTIPGTTGAGKTTAIVSFLANALTHAGGFVVVDGKADNKLFGEVPALARRFGREDDVVVLNFLVASGVPDSNTFNPFAIGNADSIRELLASQLGEQRPEDPNGVFRTGLGRTKLYELIGEGAVRTTTIGRRRLVLVSSLLRLLQTDGTPAA
jgi:intracellular multiplication protein IcmO